jgi:hypothetical protein
MMYVKKYLDMLISVLMSQTERRLFEGEQQFTVILQARGCIILNMRYEYTILHILHIYIDIAYIIEDLPMTNTNMPLIYRQ